MLLKNYVFKVVPLVNPDGVARGSWRFDTNGINLNRRYVDPDQQSQPTIAAVKEEILKEHQRGNLKLFVDFHAHRVKRGCFIYGTKGKNAKA